MGKGSMAELPMHADYDHVHYSRRPSTVWRPSWILKVEMVGHLVRVSGFDSRAWDGERGRRHSLRFWGGW